MARTMMPIKGYEKSYCITANGMVISMERRVGNTMIKGRELKAKNNGTYLFVELCQDGRKNRQYIHRLVAEAFLANPEMKCCVNHIDGNPSNNAVENLEWSTHEENVQHGYDTGLNKNKGGGHWLATGVIDNSLGMVFGSIREWCAARGVSYSTGRNLLNGSNKSRTIDLSGVVLMKKNSGHE